MRKKIATYGLGLVLAIGHASFAWVTLDRELRSFQTADIPDLEFHGWSVIFVDLPVAIPVLSGMQAMGYAYGEDSAAKARVSDIALVIAGSIYWFFGGWFAGKLLLNLSMRGLIILGFVSIAALTLVLCFGEEFLVLLLLLGWLPVLLGITNFILDRTNLLKYERQAIQ
jgi:hypothetical protein